MSSWICVAAVVFTGLVVTVQGPPQTIEAAEADGARYPKATDIAELPIYAEASGPKDRKCVDAEKYATARSGEFVAGPFAERVVMAGSGEKRKLWWTPRQADAVPPLHLRAAKIGSPDVTVDWSLTSVVHNANGYFFNTLIRFPAPGKWLVVVTAGKSWGCFVLEETPGA